MKAEDSSESDCVVNQELDRKVANHSNTKSAERLVKRSIKVLNSRSHSLVNWASTSDNFETVAEITAEIAECTNTAKSCNEQNTLMQKNDHDQDCDLQNTELDGTAVQEISIREHFESLDISQVSDFWDQV
jgi:ATP phosphoribosyltransferase